jgi:xylulose-5-phosphate/fructose-6-phosphate phosphoketolase
MLISVAGAAGRRFASSKAPGFPRIVRDSGLTLPDFRDYAVAVPAPGATTAEAMGKFLRDVMKRNLEAVNIPPLQPR